LRRFDRRQAGAPRPWRVTDRNVAGKFLGHARQIETGEVVGSDDRLTFVGLGNDGFRGQCQPRPFPWQVVTHGALPSNQLAQWLRGGRRKSVIRVTPWRICRYRVSGFTFMRPWHHPPGPAIAQRPAIADHLISLLSSLNSRVPAWPSHSNTTISVV